MAKALGLYKRPRVAISARLPGPVYRKLKVHLRERDVSLSAYVAGLVERDLVVLDEAAPSEATRRAEERVDD